MGDVLAVVVAVGVTIVVVGIVVVLGAAVRTMTAVRNAVEDVHVASMPILADVHLAVRKVNGDLERVDGILENAEAITGTADSASRLAYTAFSAPVVKTMAAVSGASRAWQRLRRKK
jgi:hypothetical protein